MGLGHLFRCLSLAKAIKTIDNKTTIIFISNLEVKEIIEDENFDFVSSEEFDDKDKEIIKNLKPEIIIFDSYLANNKYLNSLKKISKKLIIFDDNNDIYDSSIPNIIINGNLHAKELNYFNREKHLLGSKYLVMKEAYWNNDKLTKENDSNPITITTGGSDFNNLMPKFIKSLNDLPQIKNIIIGPSYTQEQIKQIENITDDSFNIIYKPKSLKIYIQNSEIIMTAAGSTVYEVLTLNKIPVIYSLAENQNLLASELKTYGIVNLGWHEDINWINLENIINKVLNNKDKYLNQLKNLSSIFDGKGALRVANKILDLKEIL